MSIDPSPAFDQIEAALKLPILYRHIPRASIEAVLQECQAVEKRRRKLPALVVLLLVIVMHWFSHESLAYVLLKVLTLPSLLSGQLPSRWVADKSSISEARYRLGARPLVELFKRVCRPQATPMTPGAFLFGKRLVALDGTIEAVADSPANATYFGRSSGHYGDSAFPQACCIYLCECATHIIFDAGIWPYGTSEKVICRRLLRSLQADMLLMVDAGLTTFDLLNAVCQRQADFLARVEKRWLLKPIRDLNDGSYLAYLAPGDYPRRQHQRLLVRVIAYTLDDPQRPGCGQRYRLITSLLDPDTAPALDLVCAYHQRWDIELTIDELDTHQRLAQRPFRSLRPVGVVQELYGLLLAHFVVRCWMLQAAQQTLLDPRRLSFINALRLLRDGLSLGYLSLPIALSDFLLDTLSSLRLPPRDNRINPRVVKRRQAKFPR
ncbi:MAG: IS4 family transposase, partial [Anaerolineae bacterium]|nr:IS4 family transposase [Anaerolineae bacterium]